MMMDWVAALVCRERESNMWGGPGGRPVTAIGGLLWSSLWPGSRDLTSIGRPWNGYLGTVSGSTATLLLYCQLHWFLSFSRWSYSSTPLQIVSRYLQLIQSVHTTTIFNLMVTIYIVNISFNIIQSNIPQ